VAIRTAADLVSFLRQSSILERDQLDEAARELQVRFPEPRALARELLQRGWLTPYQVNQLLADSGRSLVLRPYVVLERLGAGGTGQVFKARHQHMQRVVALKVIRPELLADADVVSRFHREIQVASQVSHPNVVHAYDAGDIGGAQTLVLEYVEGISLDQLVKESGPLPVPVACDYMRQTALGLQHIHECGLIHRDIKPSNLLVTGREGATNGKGKKPATGITTHHGLSIQQTVKILDLGLARLHRGRESRESTTITSAGAVTMGTPDYMAPEQALDLHAADIRADIYSLGCTLYFLLTGKPPFGGGTLAQKLMRHQQAEPPPLAKQRGGLPAGLERIVRKMLAKRPEDRYQTPGEVASALEQFTGAATVRFPVATATILGRRRRPRWLVPLAGAAALLLGGTLLWWALSGSVRTDSSGDAQAALATTPRAAVTQAPTGMPVSRPGPIPPSRPTASRPAGSGILVRGRGVVRDALIDFAKPDKRLGAEPKDNDLRRGDQCNAFLVRFDLSRAAFAPEKLDKATVSFFVWDPHDKGITKVCAFGLLTPWDEATVTWKQSAEGKPWKGGSNFAFGVDTGPASPHVTVKPDPVNDTVDPPLEYQLDVTPLARSWLADSAANHGLVIAPVVDRNIDGGWQSRFQIYASEHNRVQYTPTLTLHMRQ